MTIEGEIMEKLTEIRLIDHTTTKQVNDIPVTAITSFAIDDALAICVGKGQAPPTLRLWSHPKTIVLGIPDTRLPFIEEGVQYLAKEGYDVIVRNSGGLAVALDAGVLNMSLVLPNMKRLSIDAAYDMMYKFIKQMLVDYTDDIKAYEIVGSYCPGDYDLSIHGKKFAGISQRRVRDGVAVQVYLDITGDCLSRAKHIINFYEISRKKVQTSFTYPNINPHVLGSLNKLLTQHISFENIKQRAIATMQLQTKLVDENSLTAEEITIFMKRYEQMVKRNSAIQALLSK